MFNYAPFFLCAFGFWGLWRVQAQCLVNQQCQTALVNQKYRINQIAVHQQQWFAYNSQRRTETEERIDKLEGRLQAIRTQMEAQLLELQNLTEYQKKRKEPPRKINEKLFPTKVGTRHFYIEKQIQVNWYKAYEICRKKGGHLATIRDEREFKAIFSYVPGGAYWIDIYNLARDGSPFISSLTGRQPPYLKWKNNGPRKSKMHFHCVDVYVIEMYNEDCYDKYFFVCQAENNWE
ncbi:hypothetical protein KR084_004517 [Drosophila pseudotakahashii]|nr:hypothetical protein KR084_004517 [Drosophila pseudotakahashii]